MAKKIKAAAQWQRRLQEIREQRGRALAAVVVEFGGGERRQPMLVPEDDPANDELVLRLANEVLFLRSQLQRIAKVMELVQAGQPFALIPPGPHWKPGGRTDVDQFVRMPPVEFVDDLTQGQANHLALKTTFAPEMMESRHER